MMKNITWASMLLAIVACGHDKPAPQQPCPTCPTIACPPITPCVNPVPCVPCELPPTSPDNPDTMLAHPPSEFQILTILTDPNMLGFYVVDPNGEYDSAVFSVPTMKEQQNDNSNLTIDDGEGGTVAIGDIYGLDSPEGLVLTELCERQFAPSCTAIIYSDGRVLRFMQITLWRNQRICLYPKRQQ